MIRIGIVGATGYTALELIKLLLRHPQANITLLTSRDENRPHLSEVHPSLRDVLNLSMQPLEIESLSESVDCVFCCLPHAASAAVVGQILDAGVKVIDFSADYRLNDVATFEQWYGVEHPDADRVGSIAYGIPELFRDQIRSANLVANPGCFPSSALLPLAPLFKNELIETTPLIVDSKTGVSGAGRKANLKFHYPECNESITAYGIGTHRHMPEIDQILNRFCDSETQAVFTPHLTPMDRGILSTIYVKRRGSHPEADLMDCLNDFYRDEPFVRVTEQIPTTKDVTGTNFCDITVKSCRDMTIIVSALDNMIKGASGAAVQNFNVVHGFDETTGLL
jgi:N-acetyl-gamma-glutamyl-phosphate reductase